MTENEISYKIIGAAIEVHKNLGVGLLENAYEIALVYELQKLGLASLVELDSKNWQLISNELNTQGIQLTPIHTYDDHRMAMAFAPLVLKLNELVIEDANVVSKSYPLFWKDLEKLGFEITTAI